MPRPDLLDRERELDLVRVGVYYDFSSSLCYVAHRVLDRIETRLEETGIRLLWKPIDLTRIVPWNRGDLFADNLRQSVEATAQALDVELRMPPAWLDSRPSSAVALALAGHTGAEATWRHAVFDSIFGHLGPANAPRIDALWRQLGLDSDPDVELDPGLLSDRPADRERHTASVQTATEEAIALGVEGVPTFLLGAWPVGGIHDDDAMFQMLAGYAQTVRDRTARELVN